MEKKRKNQFILILAVLTLTIYNILPTLFYYTNPLNSPVSQELAETTADHIATRVACLEQEAIDWLNSYCQLLAIEPTSIQSKGPNLLSVCCVKSDDVALLQRYLPKAGSLIPFAPSQLVPLASMNDPKELLVERKIGISLQGAFEFVPKASEKYIELLNARLQAIRSSLSTPSWVQTQIQLLDQELSKSFREETLFSIATSITELAKVHSQHPQLAKRLAGRYTPPKGMQKFLELSASYRDDLKKEVGNEKKELLLAAAEQFIKTHKALFHTSDKNPIFQDVSLDFSQERLCIHFQPDLAGIKDPLIEQCIWAEVAHITKETKEEISSTPEGFAIAFHHLPQTTGLLVLKLDYLGQKQAQILQQNIQTLWHPKHPDLREISIVNPVEYEALSPAQKALCVVVSYEQGNLKVYFKGLNRLANALEETPNSPLAQTLATDVSALTSFLWQQGFSRSLGSEIGVFEHSNWPAPILAATREQFHVYGDKSTAWLEFSNVEQRMFTTNLIETKIHEDLLKWEDDFRASQISIIPTARLEVPKPNRSIFWSNLALTLRKIVRGDERKILRWGLDLSGGKTVQLELRDKQNHLVNDEISIKQAINELFDRVNKMGVSDVSIRQVGSHIALDFPGSQPLSASELIKASSMTFHVVDERFQSLAAQRFLQEVWNEAVASNKRDPQSIQKIAYRQLHEGPQSISAQTLLEAGLKLAHPDHTPPSSLFDDSVSKVVLLRNETTLPLTIVFANHALEGSDLENIQSNYDPSKGNYLSFSVKKSSQERLFAWTSRFSKERIAGTLYDIRPESQGWRMAVLLNGTLISAPTLEAPIKSEASISGHFSHREVMQLTQDLKAGSLSFTPRILFEKNVSPELGQQERLQGIAATLVALGLVIGAMVIYYRFAGMIASIAVLFNLLILWAVLQNLGASLSLAGLAGVILTVGMAVDANVLVFERIKEEFSVSGQISSAIHAGYKKAFSAIVDSNITTIIAALILLNFDAGPIKAFAVSMIIGIASSMFTALFMTRFYFEGWARHPEHTHLNMAHWITNTRFDFLKRSKVAFGIALAVIGLGGILLYVQRNQIFGMDFTGGYALSIELDSAQTKDPLMDVKKALVAAGIDSSDFHLRQHEPATHLQLFLAKSLEQEGKPFHALKAGASSRLEWISKALKDSGLHLTPSSSKNLEDHWTAMSGQLSDSMRNNALLGLGLAFLAIFLYIVIRFEYKYAMAAMLCLFHDVLITLGLMSLLAACSVPVQIDLNTLAALMTIIGYSLNDTIIIFDRIREDAQLYPNLSMRDIVNKAVNTTLSRTTITSGTTLLVLLALLAFGGGSIFSFALVMTLGVIFGTLSSWFIACPLMLFFHRKESASKKASLSR